MIPDIEDEENQEILYCGFLFHMQTVLVATEMKKWPKDMIILKGNMFLYLANIIFLII